MKVDEFFKEWTGQRPNLCTAFHEAGIEAMAFAEAYHKQQVKLLAAPAVSVNEVAVADATTINIINNYKLTNY